MTDEKVIIEAAKRMRTALQKAVDGTKTEGVCQECGLGQHGEFEAIAEFDAAVSNRT